MGPIARAWREALSAEHRFGIVFCLLFGLIGAQPVLSGRPPRLWALGIAAILLLLTLLAPKLLAPLNHAWLALGDRLHRIVSPIVLGVVFFGLVTPIAWLRALLGKDDLALKRRPASATYWVDVERGRSRKGGFLDPF